MRVMEEGAKVLPRTCRECGTSKGAEQFMYYRPGEYEDGYPVESEDCRTCMGPEMDVLKTRAKRERKRAAAAERRARKAAERRAKPPGRPRVLDGALLGAMIDEACLRYGTLGVTVRELYDEWGGEKDGKGCPVTMESLRRRLVEGWREGYFLRELVNPETPWAAEYRYSCSMQYGEDCRKGEKRFPPTPEGMIELLGWARRPLSPEDVGRYLGLSWDRDEASMAAFGAACEGAGKLGAVYLEPVHGRHRGGWGLASRREEFAGRKSPGGPAVPETA